MMVRLWICTLLIAIGNQLLIKGVTASCRSQCRAKWGRDKTLTSSCRSLCTKNATLFDVNYPYLLGPLTMKPYPELTGIDADEINAAFPRGGELYARVNAKRTKMQFYLNMFDNPEPYFPYFAMHLHHGNLNSEEIGGHILVHIAGKGALVSCLDFVIEPGFPPTAKAAVCSPLCTPGNMKLKNCNDPTKNKLVPPPLRKCLLCNIVLGGAYLCKGGCQNDSRILGYTNKQTGKPDTIAPSRACDINNPSRPSNPNQQTWIQGLNSNEFSGNISDGSNYSPYSIAIAENFDLWCGEELPFLVDYVFSEGAASYIALHVNFNATGIPALTYGDIFTQLSSSSGGPQNCNIFGNPNLPCVDGVSGVLKGLGDPY